MDYLNPMLRRVLLNLRLMRLFGSLDECLESSGVIDGDIGEHLAVQADTSPLETADELAVRNIRSTASRVDPNDPQRAEIALFETASDEAVAESLFNGFLGCAIQLGLGEEKPLGAAKGFVAIISPVGTSFYSGHVFSL
jgi:hypothetical protein